MCKEVEGKKKPRNDRDRKRSKDWSHTKKANGKGERIGRETS